MRLFSLKRVQTLCRIRFLNPLFKSLDQHPNRLLLLLCAVLTMTNCEKEYPVANVIVSPTSVTIEKGGSLQLNAVLKDASGKILTDRYISWSSSNTAVVSVSSNGIVNGISEGGPVNISATCEEISSTAQVLVTPIPLASMWLSPPSTTIEIGETKQLTIMLMDTHNNTLNDRSVSWQSSNEALVTISTSGVVTGISAGGPVTITATCEGKSSSSQITVIPATVASVLLTPANIDLVIGKKHQFSVSLRDARGVNLTGRTIVWSSSNPEIAAINSNGLVSALRSGSVTIITESEGKEGTAELTVKIPSDVPSGVGLMYDWLSGEITSSINYNQYLLERNPHLATQLQTKIEMLQRPDLLNEIIEGRFYAADSVKSIDGRYISLSSVFPSEEMRSDATGSIAQVKLAIPILENFIGTPYPADAFDNWYGFCMGNTNSGGTIWMEDKATYEARTGPDRLLYQNILYHELSHIYIGNETLTHFLATYLYNMVNTGTTDIQSWIDFEGTYKPMETTNTGLRALLDIYTLIGHEGMMEAFKTIASIHPPYGIPLSSECKQAFINQAPENVKERVASKIESVEG